MKKIIFILFLLSPSSGFAQQGWYFLNPTPTGNAILDVKIFNESTGICLSTNEILKTTNSGVNWNKINIPGVYKFISLHMLDSSLGFLCADSNKILKTTNGGINWFLNSTIRTTTIKKIYFLSDKKGYALQNSSDFFGSIPGKIFRTANGGLKWDSVTTDNSYFRQYHSIFFPSESVGFATGLIYLGNNNYRSQIYKTTNEGLRWDSIPNPENHSFGILYFLNENTGYTAANNHIIKTTNGGLNWSYTRYTSTTPVFLKFYNDSGYCATNNSIGKTTNGGLNWTYQYTGISYLNCFDFLSWGIAVAGNTEGKLYTSVNSGSSWNVCFSSITNTQLWDIKFSDSEHGYAIGDLNSVLKTTNGGINWSPVILTNPNSRGLSAIANVNNNVCYIAEFDYGRIFKTTNSGLSWVTLSADRYGLNRIQFLNENTGFGVCKYGSFFKTRDGGNSWYHVDTLYNIESSALDFIDTNTGMIGGSNTYKTTNGGLSWARLNPGYHIQDIKFINRDLLFAVASTYNGAGVVLKSINGGQNWNTTILKLNYPHLVQFPTERTGYIQGYDGIYKTTNQGENWFRINAGLGYGLNSFHWIDSILGYSVGNGGAILKTNDGGSPSELYPFPEYIPKSFSLYQNYPNPFNPSTKIKFDLPQSENVKIIVFDILGRKLETLLDENLTAGVHEVSWNASKYAAGVYFYMLLTNGIKESKKMVLIK